MEDRSEHIYTLLNGNKEFTTSDVLATMLGVTTRQLQGGDTGWNILEEAKDYIFKKYHKHLIVNFSGILIVDSPGYAEELLREVWKRTESSFDTMQRYKKRIDTHKSELKKQNQLQLGI